MGHMISACKLIKNDFALTLHVVSKFQVVISDFL